MSDRATTRDGLLPVVKYFLVGKSGTGLESMERRKASTVIWMRSAEIMASLACFLAALLFGVFYDLTPTQSAHLWMLEIGSEPAWVGLFTLMGVIILIGSLSRNRYIRGSCLAVAITFYSGVSYAALHAHAMPVSTSFFLATTFVLSAIWWAGPRRVGA